MKNFSVFMLVMVMVLALCTGAYAARQVFTGVSVEVPDGWHVAVDGGGWGSLSSGIDTISFEYSSEEGMDSQQFAENVSGILGGSSPVVDTGNGDFEFVLNGAPVRACMVGSVGIVMKAQSSFDKLYGVLETCIW